MSFALSARPQAASSLAGFQFNRSLPGARSLALGGAFVALADDATAAYANPAGLTILSRPEVSIEGRDWALATRYTAGGRLTGTPTGDGIDTATGLRFGEDRSDAGGISFLSCVYPRKTWAAAVYRHEALRFNTAFASEGIFRSSDRPRLGPYLFETNARIVNYGGAFGIHPVEWLRLGVGLSYYALDLDSTQSVLTDPTPITAPADFDAQTVAIAETFSNDSAIGFNVGFLANLGTSWTLGGAYRRMPSFDARVSLTGFGVPGRSAVFNAPDQAAFGVTYRPVANPRLAVIAEYDWVEYSSLLGGDLFNESEFRNFRLSDASEFRLGVEYANPLTSGGVLAFRAGAWLDPDHRIVYAARADELGTDSGLFRAAYFAGTGKDRIHASAGLGLALHRFQIDAGVDLSKDIATYSLSAVARF